MHDAVFEHMFGRKSSRPNICELREMGFICNESANKGCKIELRNNTRISIQSDRKGQSAMS